MKYLFSILFFFWSLFSSAQITISYSIGVLGSDLKTSTFSNPLSINGKKCIMVSNGISKYIVSDHGIFLNECAVSEDYIKYSIKIAPNPATDYTIVRFKNKLQVEEKFELNLYGSNGQLLKNYRTTQTDLLGGYRFSTSEFREGLYFIQILSKKITQTFRLIILN